MEKHKERERKIRVCSMSVQKQATSIDREGGTLASQEE